MQEHRSVVKLKSSVDIFCCLLRIIIVKNFVFRCRLLPAMDISTIDNKKVAIVARCIDYMILVSINL